MNEEVLKNEVVFFVVMMLKGKLLARKKKAIGNGHIKLAEKFERSFIC